MFVSYLRESDGPAFDRMMSAILDGCAFAEAVDVGYNRQRPHQALGYVTPMAVWCDGVVDAVAAQAVDMMDNARALPTCPQPQQQQQTALLAA
jgi:hypothetical protein